MNTLRDHHMYVKAVGALSEVEFAVCKREGQRLATENVTTTQPSHYEQLSQALSAAGSPKDSGDLDVLAAFHTEWQVALDLS